MFPHLKCTPHNREGSTAEEQDEEPEANQQESTGGDAGDESEDVNGDENGDDGAEPDGNNEAEPAGEVLDVEENKTSEDTNQVVTHMAIAIEMNFY